MDNSISSAVSRYLHDHHITVHPIGKNGSAQAPLPPEGLGEAVPPEGTGKAAFHCVLFDMDGVLYNSMPHHAIAWQQSMEQFGIHMTAADAYATEGARGIDTIRHFVREQQGKDITLDEAQQMYDVKTSIFHQMGEAPIFDGVLPLMARIKAAGMKICIVTGSGQRPLIKRLVTDFHEFIDEKHIVTAYDVERGKPAPDPYLMGLRKCGCQPTEGIVVENAPLGVRAGVAAGCFTVAINSGPLPDEALLKEGCHLLYPTITAFLHDFDALITP